MRYALDTDVISSLHRADEGARLAGGGRIPALLVTDVVWEELARPAAPNSQKRGGEALEEYARALCGGPTPLAAQSPEAGTFAALQDPPRTEGPGEHSVIAFCHHHADTIAVLQDKAALRRAVEELRGRVLSFHGLLEVLVGTARLDWEGAGRISARYRRQYPHARVPVWWP